MSLLTFSFIYYSPVSFTNLLVFCHTEKNQLWSNYSKASLSCPLSFQPVKLKKKSFISFDELSVNQEQA